MKVKDIGIKEVYCANPSMNLSEAATLMKRHNIGILPVCEGKKLAGVITDRDLVVTCVAADMNPRECRVKEFMTSSPISVTPDMDLEEAAHIMGREQVHRLPVIDDGELVGILSLGDMAVAFHGNDPLVAQTLRRISTPAHAVVC